MEIRFYSFPMLVDGIPAMEKQLTTLEKREKRGEILEQEEQDWMHYAITQLYQKSI